MEVLLNSVYVVSEGRFDYQRAQATSVPSYGNYKKIILLILPRLFLNVCTLCKRKSTSFYVRHWTRVGSALSDQLLAYKICSFCDRLVS